MRVLVAEDNEILSKNVRAFLKLEGVETEAVTSGSELAYAVVCGNFDAVILDLWLPGLDGLSACEKLRESGSDVPVLMLTARSSKEDKIAGFRAGTDDYMTKPFDYDELSARLAAIVRRGNSAKGAVIKIKGLEIRFDERKVLKDGNEIRLSALEFNLFTYLVRHKGKTISKEELMEKVWGEYDAFETSRTVDVYVGYLRKKLGKDLVETVRWSGYLFTE